MENEHDVSVPARAIAEPTRARMLVALLGGVHRPAGDLARAAGVAPSTASEHLRVLVETELVTAVRSGRHRYFSLAGPEVARAVEALQAIAPTTPVRSLRQHRIAADLRAGRRCYDHLAGDLGLRVADLVRSAGIVPDLSPGEVAAAPIPFPRNPVVAALDLASAVVPRRRPFVRACLDWSGRRPHIAGALGDHLFRRFEDAGWIASRPGSRAVRLTEAGESVLVRLERS